MTYEITPDIKELLTIVKEEARETFNNYDLFVQNLNGLELTAKLEPVLTKLGEIVTNINDFENRLSETPPEDQLRILVEHDFEKDMGFVTKSAASLYSIFEKIAGGKQSCPDTETN
jgi:hypothetical protein